MSIISKNDWVVLKDHLHNPNIATTPALHVERIFKHEGRTLCEVLNPLEPEPYLYDEEELALVKVDVSELELEVILAFMKMPSEWYEPLSQYIDELRKRLGLEPLRVPFYEPNTKGEAK